MKTKVMYTRTQKTGPSSSDDQLDVEVITGMDDFLYAQSQWLVIHNYRLPLNKVWEFKMIPTYLWIENVINLLHAYQGLQKFGTNLFRSKNF